MSTADTAQDKKYVESRNVSMYPDDWKLVESLSRKLKVSVSAALRIIIEQWERQQ